MSTEALNLDQAVERFMAPQDEPVQGEDAELDSAADSLIEDTEETDVDSDVDNSDDYEEAESEDDAEYDDEYDTDESAEDDDEAPDQEAPETYTVKVDGVEQQVTLAELTRSYSGQGKIQKNMQETAEIRKQAMAAQQQAAQIAQTLTAMYQQVQEQGFIAPPTEPDPGLADEDPVAYTLAERDYKVQMRRFQTQQQQLAQAKQFERHQENLARQQMVRNEMETLLQKAPEFRDTEKVAKLKEDMLRVGGEYGYTPEDLGNVVDHRALIVLRDAIRWRNSQAKRSQVEKKAQGARPVIKPQAKKTQNPKAKKARQAKANLKKTGSIEAAMAALGIE